MPVSTHLNNKILKFFLSFVGLTLVWFMAYEFYIKHNGKLDELITVITTKFIILLLNFSGYSSFYTPARQLGETYIYINQSTAPIVRMGASCNGLELFVLFIFYIIAYPGKWKYKIPFMIFGIALIFMVNVLRSYWLTLMSYHHSPYFDLFHRYIFIFLIYGVVFLLWMIWAKYYSNRGYVQ